MAKAGQKSNGHAVGLSSTTQLTLERSTSMHSSARSTIIEHWTLACNIHAEIPRTSDWPRFQGRPPTTWLYHVIG